MSLRSGQTEMCALLYYNLVNQNVWKLPCGTCTIYLIVVCLLICRRPGLVRNKFNHRLIIIKIAAQSLNYMNSNVDDQIGNLILKFVAKLERCFVSDSNVVQNPKHLACWTAELWCYVDIKVTSTRAKSYNQSMNWYYILWTDLVRRRKIDTWYNITEQHAGN